MSAISGRQIAVPQRARIRPRRPRPLAWIVLLLAVACSLFPLYWMFVVASNDSQAVNRIPPTVVPGPNFLAHAGMVLEQIQFGAALVNSFLVAGTITVAVVFLSTLAGFAFAKLRFRGRNALFVIVLGTMMVPLQLGIIPQFMLMSELGWINELKAVIVPGMISAFGVFWMRQFVQSAVPDELIDAARVDGATTFGVYRHVILPAVRPAAAVLGLFTFMFAWNDFFWPLVVLRDPSKFTVQIALQQLNDAYYQDYGMVMAGTFLGTLPVLVLFLLLGRHLIGGLMEGAVKG